MTDKEKPKEMSDETVGSRAGLACGEEAEKRRGKDA